MKNFRDYITENEKLVKIFITSDKEKYKMLNKAKGIIIKEGKSKSIVKITDLSETDLYRPKTDGISAQQIKKSADKTFLNKEFSLDNKYIISTK